MRRREVQKWNARPAAIAVALPYHGVSAAITMASIREKFERMRDTLVVLGMQLSFRVVTWMRHLNY